MSEYKVPLTAIKEIIPHNNADALEIAIVYGFQIVVKKGQYKVGDTVVYVPIDSILPKKLEDFLFPEGSKIKLHKSRVRQIRIRNFPSQGMIVSADDVKYIANITKLPPLETDLASTLNINKYEPPAPDWVKSKGGDSRNKPLENPLFKTYKGISNIKWFPDLFKHNEEVVIQEKLHGSSVRAGRLKTVLPSKENILNLAMRIPKSSNKFSDIKSLLNMIKRLVFGKVGLLPKYENVYGSNNVELTHRVGYSGYYGEDVYGKVLKKVNAFDKIKNNEIIYGELIGEGIQKNYNYGHKNEHHFVLFDVMVINEDCSFFWLSPTEAELYAKERGFDFVPILYEGIYNKELAYNLTKGDSVYNSSQKIREGVVIKSKVHYNDLSMPSGKRSLKYISEAYLDKNNTDFH